MLTETTNQQETNVRTEEWMVYAIHILEIGNELLMQLNSER